MGVNSKKKKEEKEEGGGGGLNGKNTLSRRRSWNWKDALRALRIITKADSSPVLIIEHYNFIPCICNRIVLNSPSVVRSRPVAKKP